MAERDPLEDFFAAARAEPARPSAGLMARIAADAAREVPRPLTPAPPAQRRPGLLDVLGGWPALAGLATATLAGVWIGAADPLGVDPLAYVGAGAISTADLAMGYADLDWGVE